MHRRYDEARDFLERLLSLRNDLGSVKISPSLRRASSFSALSMASAGWSAGFSRVDSVESGPPTYHADESPSPCSQWHFPVRNEPDNTSSFRRECDVPAGLSIAAAHVRRVRFPT